MDIGGVATVIFSPDLEVSGHWQRSQSPLQLLFIWSIDLIAAFQPL
jgi:hypothetical protein